MNRPALVSSIDVIFVWAFDREDIGSGVDSFVSELQCNGIVLVAFLAPNVVHVIAGQFLIELDRRVSITVWNDQVTEESVLLP